MSDAKLDTLFDVIDLPQSLRKDFAAYVAEHPEAVPADIELLIKRVQRMREQPDKITTAMTFEQAALYISVDVHDETKSDIPVVIVSAKAADSAQTIMLITRRPELIFPWWHKYGDESVIPMFAVELPDYQSDDEPGESTEQTEVTNMSLTSDIISL